MKVWDILFIFILTIISANCHQTVTAQKGWQGGFIICKMGTGGGGEQVPVYS